MKSNISLSENNSFKQWCSNIVKLSNSSAYEEFDPEIIYFIFLKYKIWNESYLDLKKNVF